MPNTADYKVINDFIYLLTHLLTSQGTVRMMTITSVMTDEVELTASSSAWESVSHWWSYKPICNTFTAEIHTYRCMECKAPV